MSLEIDASAKGSVPEQADHSSCVIGRISLEMPDGATMVISLAAGEPARCSIDGVECSLAEVLGRYPAVDREGERRAMERLMETARRLASSILRIG